MLDRRQFLKLGGATAFATLFGGCEKIPRKLIPFVIPPENYTLGEAFWYASVCGQCPAGCGIVVRVSEGRARKIEGNPLHPVNRGKLCARGQAALQALYHPERLSRPMKLSGARGSGTYAPVSWEEALSLLMGPLKKVKAEAPGALLMLTEPMRGHAGLVAGRFMKAFGSPHRVMWDPLGPDAMLSANAAVHGVRDLPEYDLANARYLLSFSGDFLETGISPVHYAGAYGRMRGDRETIRGKFVHFGPRLSMTAASADLFLPCAPGTEGFVALGIAHVMVRDGHTAASSAAGRLADDLGAYSPEEVEKKTGVHAHDVAAVAEEFSRNQPGLAIAGTAAATGPDGAFHCGAAALLNVLAGNVGKPGGVSFPNRAQAFAKYGAEAALLAPSPESGYAGMRAALEKMRGGAFRMAILSGATNPAFTLPPSLKFGEALSKIPFVVAFASFLDETTSQADLVLPVPTALEAWGDDTAPVGHSGAITLCQPVVNAFHDTRSMPDVLIAAAKELGGEPAKALPWSSFRECIEKAYGGPGGEMENALRRGGNFGESSSPRSVGRTAIGFLPKATVRPVDGDPKTFPLSLHLYPSVTLYDGRGANLSWLQEMPDPITTAVWRNWVEVNPKTAAGLGLAEGDGVTVTSPSGKITAHVAFNPGIAPDAAAMPLGQGHTRYGKYANGRGENPISLLPAGETYALQATRVSLSKTKLSTTLARTAHPEGQWKISNLM
ncbi:molybdopterin-containing oxidoreductase family protein [Candidatus Deferrimicrobium sp.]|uniref:molybdopterin-containing oxidoreductase family protein n=1 Tax=Candidatus Deferrimicrobium sp. TaxID=3060586 RepID=UPI003C670FB7